MPPDSTVPETAETKKAAKTSKADKADNKAEKPAKVKPTKTLYNLIIPIECKSEHTDAMNRVRKAAMKSKFGNPYGTQRDGEAEPISGTSLEVDEVTTAKFGRWRIEQVGAQGPTPTEEASE